MPIMEHIAYVCIRRFRPTPQTIHMVFDSCDSFDGWRFMENWSNQSNRDRWHSVPQPQWCARPDWSHRILGQGGDVHWCTWWTMMCTAVHDEQWCALLYMMNNDVHCCTWWTMMCTDVHDEQWCALMYMMNNDVHWWTWWTMMCTAVYNEQWCALMYTMNNDVHWCTWQTMMCTDVHDEQWCALMYMMNNDVHWCTWSTMMCTDVHDEQWCALMYMINNDVHWCTWWTLMCTAVHDEHWCALMYMMNNDVHCCTWWTMMCTDVHDKQWCALMYMMNNDVHWCTWSNLKEVPIAGRHSVLQPPDWSHRILGKEVDTVRPQFTLLEISYPNPSVGLVGHLNTIHVFSSDDERSGLMIETCNQDIIGWSIPFQDDRVGTDWRPAPPTPVEVHISSFAHETGEFGVVTSTKNEVFLSIEFESTFSEWEFLENVSVNVSP